MKLLNVSSIQRGSVYDGPGVRTSIFLNGCSLNCPWCCNPETLTSKTHLVEWEKCDEFSMKFPEYCSSCSIKSGHEDPQNCPFNFAKPINNFYSAKELFTLLSKDFTLFKNSNGGITFSGGEPLLQTPILLELIKMLNEENINIAIETSLVAPKAYVQQISGLINHFIIDLKLQPSMKLYDSNYISQISSHLKIVDGKQKTFRLVFLNEIIDAANVIIEQLKRFNVNRVELLKCHNLAENKYRKLGLTCKKNDSDIEKLNQFSQLLTAANIQTQTLQV